MLAESFKIHQIYYEVIRKGLNPATKLPNEDLKPPVWYLTDYMRKTGSAKRWGLPMVSGQAR